MKNRDRNRIDPHKHESHEDRTRRHQQAAGKPVRHTITLEEHDALHREAEAATLFNPDHRQGQRKHHTNPAVWLGGE